MFFFAQKSPYKNDVIIQAFILTAVNRMKNNYFLK